MIVFLFVSVFHCTQFSCQVTPMSSDQKEKVPLIKRMFSSGTSALITKTIVTPFDVVKTYIQVEVEKKDDGIGGVYHPRAPRGD